MLLEANMGKDGDPLLGPTKWTWTLTRARLGLHFRFFPFSHFSFFFFFFFLISMSGYKYMTWFRIQVAWPLAQLGLFLCPPSLTTGTQESKSQEPWPFHRGMRFNFDRRPSLPAWATCPPWLIFCFFGFMETISGAIRMQAFRLSIDFLVWGLSF